MAYPTPLLTRVSLDHERACCLSGLTGGAFGKIVEGWRDNAQFLCIRE